MRCSFGALALLLWGGGVRAGQAFIQAKETVNHGPVALQGQRSAVQPDAPRVAQRVHPACRPMRACLPRREQQPVFLELAEGTVQGAHLETEEPEALEVLLDEI